MNTKTKSFQEWTDEYVRDNIHKLKAPMTKFVHIVQVHPVYNGILQTHKVKAEFEFNAKEEAEMFINRYNAQDGVGFNPEEVYQAFYYGCVNDETGELV